MYLIKTVGCRFNCLLYVIKSKQLGGREILTSFVCMGGRRRTYSSRFPSFFSSFLHFVLAVRHNIDHSVAYCVISIVGIFGNSAVLVVVAKSPQMRTLTNQFIANLAIADLLVNILVLPFTLVANLFPGKIDPRFLLNEQIGLRAEANPIPITESTESEIENAKQKPVVFTCFFDWLAIR